MNALEPAFSDVRLHVNKELFVLRTTDGKNTLSINRKTNAISTTFGEAENTCISGDSGCIVHGLLGSLKMLSGNYLVVIKERIFVAEIFGNKIYRMAEPMLLPYCIDIDSVLTNDQQRDERRYLDLLKLTFSNQAFYFSYTYDVTTHLQNWFKSEKTSLWREADDHFMWNKYLARDLIEMHADGWIIPIIRGFVQFKEADIDGQERFQFGLLSRLSWKRAGTRYNTRGADRSGNVANYVETEQVIIYRDKLISFMQVRGSIPLKWSQKPNLTYKPKLKITTNASGTNPFQIHFKNQLDRYNHVLVVNLINSTGSEGKLGDAYLKQHTEFNNSNMKFVSFDFHKKTKSTNYGGLNELISAVQDSINDFGYFMVDLKERKVIKSQTGVLRVNCIDCLDRTNVCESIFGRLVLNKELKDLELLKNDDKVDNKVSLERLFKSTWADNGDALSLLYAGTGALKADFTRTGKRTFIGLLNDGYNSITRYYYNNFSDGFKEDGMNLLLGKYVVEKGENPFLPDTAMNNVYSVCKYALLISLLMIVVNFLLLFTDPGKFQRLSQLLIWVGIALADYFFLIFNGKKIVNKPMLKKKEIVIGGKSKKE